MVPAVPIVLFLVVLIYIVGGAVGGFWGCVWDRGFQGKGCAGGCGVGIDWGFNA